MRNRKWLTLVARVIVSGGMLAFLVYKINQSRSQHGQVEPILPPWGVANALWLGLAFVLTFVSVLVSSIRWKAVLLALDVERMPRLRRLFSHYLAGLFVGNVLPSTVGGDVLRVTRLAQDTDEPPASFASVILERLTGWLVLPGLILAGFAINRGFLHEGKATKLALVIAVGTLVLLVGVSAALVSRRLGGRLGHAEGWRRFAGAVHLGAAHLRHHPQRAVSVVGIGVIYQLVLVVAAFSAARTLGVGAVGFTAILTFFPAVLIAQVLPISISGLGIREGLFVLFLHPLGVPDGKSVALGILIYLLTLCVSLFGAPSFALGHRRRKVAAP